MAYHHVSGPHLASRLKSYACRKVPLVFVGGCVKYLCTLGECVPSRPPRPPPKEREKQLLFSRPPASQRKCLLKGLVRVFCCYLGSKCFLTLITPWTVASQAPLWDFPGKNIAVSCHFLLQGIFLTQGLNRVAYIVRQILYH